MYFLIHHNILDVYKRQVLAQSIVGVGLKNVTAGANPMDLKRGIDKAVAKVVESITVSYTHLPWRPFYFVVD